MIEKVIGWLEAHEGLAGWAQFAGAVLALAVTYFTAFAPVWRQKRQLRNAAARLLSHGYEAIESYHRTSAYFDPFPLSLRQAAFSMQLAADEMGRFPIYELDEQGSNSLARRLVAMSVVLGSTRLILESMASDLEGRAANEDDKDSLRVILGQALTNAEALIAGKILARPDPPPTQTAKSETA